MLTTLCFCGRAYAVVRGRATVILFVKIVQRVEHLE
jgi:hypothetical protein